MTFLAALAMEYGLIASREVRKGTKLGQVLKQKLALQKAQNLKRRQRGKS